MADVLIKYENSKESNSFFIKQLKRWNAKELVKNPFLTSFCFRPYNKEDSFKYAYINMKPLYPRFTLFLIIPSFIAMFLGLAWSPLSWVGLFGCLIATALEIVFSPAFLFFGLKLGLKREGYKASIERLKGDKKAEVLIEWLNEKY